MKCYLKYNFQYLITTLLGIGLTLYHLINTGRFGIVIGGLFISIFSIGWSLFRHNELFGTRK